MRILFSGLNFYPELTGIGKYTGEMARFLTSLGDDVCVVTTPPYYPEWKVHDGYIRFGYAREFHNRAVVYRCPLYVPPKPSTVTRLVHLLSYALMSAPVVLYLAVKNRPDIVVTIQPTMFAAPFALLAARLSGAKAVMHIQDFELDAMLGLGMSKGGVVARAGKAVERWLMKRFDKVSTISYSMMDNARSKGVLGQNLIFFPNWADTDFVTPDVDGSALRSRWGVADGETVVLYAGNIGKKQGLEVVVKAAKALKQDANVKFFIVGSGAHVDQLKQLASEAELDNLAFKPLQAWEDVPAMLAMADVHLVVQKKGAADVVLPSKLTNILSAGGNALVTAEKETELGLLEEKYPGIYKRIEPEDDDMFISALGEMVDMCRASTQKQVNQVARDYAVSNLNRDMVLSRFKTDLEELVAEK
ncbi:MAG: WcaI family glycosyltransferase [Pontibacterium sp.]